MSRIDWNELYENMKIYKICTSKHLEFLQINSPELLKKIMAYKKENNGCYCYPQRCSGDIIIKILVSYTFYNFEFPKRVLNFENISILLFLSKSKSNYMPCAGLN